MVHYPGMKGIIYTHTHTHHLYESITTIPAFAMFLRTLATSFLFIISFMSGISVAAHSFVLDHPPVKLDLTKRLSPTSGHRIIRQDLQRLRFLRSNRGRGAHVPRSNDVHVPLANEAFRYTASVGIGSPPTFCKSFGAVGTGS